jgi:DNA-binding SARP family transcriptional activator/TolB-like protein
MFLLKLFGTVSIEGPNGVVTGKAARRHALALLALLTLSRSRRLTRDKLIGYLWPESGSSHARNLLNQSVHALRLALGDEAIRSEGDELVINPDAVACDVWQFEGALASGDVKRAVDLYMGPFADGFFLSDSVEFERWADGERERLRRGYLKALEECAENATAQGDLKPAAEWWRKLATEEPYNSNITLRLMQALESAGDRAGAIKEAEAHAGRLRADLDAAPNPAVLALAERMRTQPIGSVVARGSPDHPPGVGEQTATLPEQEWPVGPRRSWKPAAIIGAGLALLVFASWAVMNLLERDTFEIRSLAVIPFANLTGDPEQDYFVAGMHDALVTELGQIAALKVISRQSMIRYLDSDLPLPAIARELGVDALVEGSVPSAGDSVRMTVQVIRAEPEEHLWARTYERPLRNALALQGEVAQGIARAIDATVEPAVETRLASKRVVDLKAQEAYLRGLYQMDRQTTMATARSARIPEQRSAISYLEEAVALDPEWAAAHARLSLAYTFFATSSDVLETEVEFFGKAKAAALRALDLDETEALAHVMLGLVLSGWQRRGIRYSSPSSGRQPRCIPAPGVMTRPSPSSSSSELDWGTMWLASGSTSDTSTWQAGGTPRESPSWKLRWN